MIKIKQTIISKKVYVQSTTCKHEGKTKVRTAVCIVLWPTVKAGIPKSGVGTPRGVRMVIMKGYKEAIVSVGSLR